MCSLPFPRPYARTGEVKNFKTWNFFLKIATILFLLSYSLDILISNDTQVFGLLTANYNQMMGFPIIKCRTNAAVYALRL